jgi:AAA15 family ATPase/GTPase
MLKSLKIKNFRCFEELDLPQLGRVNLLVGKNNSGKTSILEAVHILNSSENLKPFSDIIDNRGEYYWSEKDGNKDLFDVSHFFYGHHIVNGSILEILGVDDEDREVKFTLSLSNNSAQEIATEAVKKQEYLRYLDLDAAQPVGGLNCILKWEKFNGSNFFFCLPLKIPFNHVISMTQEETRTNLMMLNSSNVNAVIAQFNRIVLTPEEETLYESLRAIEPGIERIASVATQGYRGSGNGGFVVSINKQRIPIGSMGYGIWRMLEITLAMVNIPGGTLLIDEIDTGLHFSVMVDLWKLICKTAEKLDIQVFATTHNSDCWKSLAEVANSDDIASDDITIHRIERGKKASIVFNEQEMAIAADRDIEVR